jgi:2-C-methyl-D-erythritol 4-phosphate cytidylyltransferase
MSNVTSVWAVVPAAGIGSRMQADKPKQYLRLNDKPILEHTLHRLASHPRIKGIVIALADNDPWWSSINLPTDCDVISVIGGETRADSVLNALKKLHNETHENVWVLVHDAARPCLRHEDIDAMLEQLCDHPVGGILGMPLADTVKRVDESGVIVDTVDRTGLWRAATPQMFRLGQLAFCIAEAQSHDQNVTDEASAIEYAGLQPQMVCGHADNIKITVPSDLALAELFLAQQLGG